jgi:hypothetical protein
MQYFAGYLIFVSIAYHKVVLSIIGISESGGTRALASTRDFWQQPAIERLGFALIWGTTGMLAVTFIWLIVNSANEIRNARTLTREYANVKATSGEIYRETLKHVAAGFSPLFIFPICTSLLLPLSYRLIGELVDGGGVAALPSGLLSLILGMLAMSLLGLSVKLVRAAFA